MYGQQLDVLQFTFRMNEIEPKPESTYNHKHFRNKQQHITLVETALDKMYMYLHFFVPLDYCFFFFLLHAKTLCVQCTFFQSSFVSALLFSLSFIWILLYIGRWLVQFNKWNKRYNKERDRERKISSLFLLYRVFQHSRFLYDI